MRRPISLLTNIPAFQPFFHRISAGWDPIDVAYADRYGSDEWKSHAITRVCHTIEQRLGGLADKKVLDLGAGPGQYAIALALRGADVTWHDPSRNYLAIAREEAARAQVECDWRLGYLGEVRDYPPHTFDLVFCRICWYYCISDRRLAHDVVSVLKPGGCAWLDINLGPTEAYGTSSPRRLVWWLYTKTGFKLGHLKPPKGKVAGILARDSRVDKVDVDYSTGNERIWCVTHAHSPGPRGSEG